MDLKTIKKILDMHYEFHMTVPDISLWTRMNEGTVRIVIVASWHKNTRTAKIVQEEF